ncbi:hypothetical protein JCM5353_000736 [Sporobolomyces roseus]
MSRMFESHELTPQEEQERKDDLRKQEERGREFKNRLEIIKNPGIRKGIAKQVMKEWRKEMEDTFMHGGRANWELYHDEGWEKVAEVLTEMEDDFNHDVPIIETTGRTLSILPKYQAESILRSIEALYPRYPHSSSLAASPSPDDRSSTSHRFVEKETQNGEDMRNLAPQDWLCNPWHPGARRDQRDQRDRRPRLRQSVTRKF